MRERSESRSRCAGAVTVLLGGCVLSLIAHAAPGGAAITGTVRSEQGEGMPGVMLTLTCGSGAVPTIPLRLLTDAAGSFAFKGIDPSFACHVQAEVPGYAKVVVGPISLRAGKIHHQEIRLIPAADATEVVLVEAHGAVVDTETAATSTTINEGYIEALPIVGRSFQDLLTLAPGVTDVDGDGNPNVHGARETGLQYRLDGADVTDPLTGHFGHHLNLDAIQEIEIITSGAGAEHSRADGGFVNIVTKSGGNDLQGSLRIFFRSEFLDGDGAGNQDLFAGSAPQALAFRDTKGALTLGGPMRRDRLWYFLSVESMDVETPVSIGGGGAAWSLTDRGYHGFAKITWQASPDHKVSLQHTFDPRRRGGLGLGVGVLPESDYDLETGARTSTLRWTSILSPVLLMETTLSHYEGGMAFNPVSSRFKPTEVEIELQQIGAGLLPVAHYPCNRPNCLRAIGPTNVYQHDVENRTTSGPFYFDNGDRRVRNSLRTEFTLDVEDLLGAHTIKSGAEFSDESYDDRFVSNPILYSYLRQSRGCRTCGLHPLAVEGSQTLLMFSPLRTEASAVGGGPGAFVKDSWKPRPNIAIGAGVRLDFETTEAAGREPFAVREQARRVLQRFDWACELAGSACEGGRLPGRPSGPLPLRVPIPAGHPLEAFDRNEDGWFDMGPGGEAGVIWGLYTTPEERQWEYLSIRNRNLAPRFSLAWDPWNDGRTRVSASWGRYHDRLFLGTVAAEQFPSQTAFTFYPGAEPTPWIKPGDTSGHPSTSSTFMVARDLATPYQDERTITVEREIAPEWSVRITALHRGWWDLLQDFDVNHITCPDFRRTFGIDPHEVCGLQGRLWLDFFGDADGPGGSGRLPGEDPAGGQGTYSMPNGVVDLYTVNPRFNSIYKVGNYNGQSYRALEVVLDRRLHRGWQMQGSYTFSAARGDAESFLSYLGDDPATRGDEAGFLDYDQRHVVKVFAASHLKRGIRLGWKIEWASGTPYSVVREVQDADDRFNISPRTIYVTGRRNDQRNGGVWDLSARVERSFRMGPVSAEAFVSAENLLDQDDLRVFRSIIEAGGTGADQSRRFGRRVELGASIHF